MSPQDSSDGPVRLGITGVGKRGTALLELCLEMPDVAVPAVCDVQERNVEGALEAFDEADLPAPDVYEDHAALVARDDLDGVVIATPWEHHVPMAVTAMEHGVYPGLEVGPASTVEECWDLVETREETGVPCMLLENACYGRDMMAVLRMVREGLFGELVHCRCGYLHDIRSRLVTGQDQSVDVVDGVDFRTLHSLKRNGDVYPTHGLGPVATYLDVNRGNRFVSLTATASKSAGLDAWAEENLDEDDPARSHEWTIGDVITTTITCANGESVVVTHDCSLPRPKERDLHVQGTGGLWQDDDGKIYVEGRSPHHEWESFEAYRAAYEHPLWERFEEIGIRGSHGGMDYPTLREYVTAVRHGATPPIDVYDTATLMAITPLTERSIALGSEPVAIPDFTNGRWLSRTPTFGFDERRDGRPPVTDIFPDSA